MDKDKVYFKLIKSKNEDTIKCKEYIINEINNKIGFYNKNGYIRIVIDVRKYSHCEVERKWIVNICEYYLGKCEISMYYCLLNNYNCNLTIKKIQIK